MHTQKNNKKKKQNQVIFAKIKKLIYINTAEIFTGIFDKWNMTHSPKNIHEWNGYLSPFSKSSKWFHWFWDN